MPRPKYKQRCALCKENMVIMYSGNQFPKCVACHMKEIDKPVNDSKYKKLFDIPRELYEKSLFLRNIKSAYLRFESLTERQVEAFKKTVKDMKNSKSEDSI